jgi:hypothetical protein
MKALTANRRELDKAPNSNLQAPEKLQAPSTNLTRVHDLGRLVIGASLDVGAWMLELHLI